MQNPTPGTVHFSQLPAAPPGSDREAEWNTYRKEVGRLIAEGHEGKWVVIERETVIGIWNTLEEARDVAGGQFKLRPPYIQQVLSQEPIRRGPMPFRLCRSSIIKLRPTG